MWTLNGNERSVSLSVCTCSCSFWLRLKAICSCVSSSISMVTGKGRASWMNVGVCSDFFVTKFSLLESSGGNVAWVQRKHVCVCVCCFTFWLSSLLMAKASWSCSSSSPLVWGRACSRSEAARGDEDEAAQGTSEGVWGRMQWWGDQIDVGMHETCSTGSVGLMWIFPGPRCSFDHLCAGLQHFTRDQPDTSVYF